MKNKWKIGFSILFGINLLGIMLLCYLILLPGKQTAQPEVKEQKGNYVSFYIQSNKEDLNKLVNYYIKKEAAGSSVDYQVVLGNEVELHGSLPFFGNHLNMMLTFEPEALKNGNLVLRQKSIMLGSLHLPIPYVMEFIRENYKLPAGVDIQPNNNLVYINMQQIKLKSNAQIKVNKFDLKKDDIAFTLLVPVT